MAESNVLLVGENLERRYRRDGSGRGREEWVAAVDGVSLELHVGAALGIVGASGCGKSTLVRLLLALEKPDRGSVFFEGQPISHLPESKVRPFRRRFQAVFQDPGASLDPCLQIGTIVAEPLAAHGIGDRGERRRIVRTMLEQVGMPADCAGLRPHEFSGGERQRIAIARAMTVSPTLLVLDEPVSSLDRPVQAQILALIRSLRDQHLLSLILVSHDLQVIQSVCEEVAVMHQGQIVESGRTTKVMGNPTHPKTAELTAAGHGHGDGDGQG